MAKPQKKDTLKKIKKLQEYVLLRREQLLARKQQLAGKP